MTVTRGPRGVEHVNVNVDEHENGDEDGNKCRHEHD